MSYQEKAERVIAFCKIHLLSSNDILNAILNMSEGRKDIEELLDSELDVVAKLPF